MSQNNSSDKDSKTWPELRVGVSSCLIGNRVRHDGEHKKNDWMIEQLAPFVTWVPICPEMEMGLGAPRETLRLVGQASNPRLFTVKSKLDKTDHANATNDRILKDELHLDAYIFKKDSPSCGVERVKVYGISGIPTKNGVGLFAHAFQKRYPKVPVIEEGRFNDSAQRESFLIQLFTYGRFSRLLEESKKVNALQLFHQDHKLQLMAYDPGGYKFLGRIAANSDNHPVDQVFDAYREQLFTLLKKPLTTKKYVNAFQHILGYFKGKLEPGEVSHILKLLEDYRQSRIPLISVSTLFGYLVQKHSIQYLLSQSILNPYPREILTLGE